MREQSIVGSYYRLAPEKRLDLIIYHYDCFPAMIKDYELGLKDLILTARSVARQESFGDLGVRVQSGNVASSPTDSIAMERLQVDSILEKRVLDYCCKRLSCSDELERGLQEMKLMEYDYKRVKARLGTIHRRERELFIRYVTKEDRSNELSEELTIRQASVRKKIYRIKKSLFEGFSLGSYSDDTILLVEFPEEDDI